MLSIFKAAWLSDPGSFSGEAVLSDAPTWKRQHGDVDDGSPKAGETGGRAYTCSTCAEAAK